MWRGCEAWLGGGNLRNSPVRGNVRRARTRWGGTPPCGGLWDFPPSPTASLSRCAGASPASGGRKKGRDHLAGFALTLPDACSIYVLLSTGGRHRSRIGCVVCSWLQNNCKRPLNWLNSADFMVNSASSKPQKTVVCSFALKNERHTPLWRISGLPPFPRKRGTKKSGRGGEKGGVGCVVNCGR